MKGVSDGQRCLSKYGRMRRARLHWQGSHSFAPVSNRRLGRCNFGPCAPRPVQPDEPCAGIRSLRRRRNRRPNTRFLSCHLSNESARSKLSAARFVGECLSDIDIDIDSCVRYAYEHEHLMRHGTIARACFPCCHLGSRFLPAIPLGCTVLH